MFMLTISFPLHMDASQRCEPLACSFVRYSGKVMPRARKAANWKELTPEERRERRQLRREKQREDNIGRAAKMHAARLRMEAESAKGLPELKSTVYVGCSGWRYWKWRDSFYANVPQENWFEHYLKRFDTVEITHHSTRGPPLPTSRPGGASPARKCSFTP